MQVLGVATNTGRAQIGKGNTIMGWGDVATLGALHIRRAQCVEALNQAREWLALGRCAVLPQRVSWRARRLALVSQLCDHELPHLLVLEFSSAR